MEVDGGALQLSREARRTAGRSGPTRNVDAHSSTPSAAVSTSNACGVSSAGGGHPGLCVVAVHRDLVGLPPDPPRQRDRADEGLHLGVGRAVGQRLGDPAERLAVGGEAVGPLRDARRAAPTPMSPSRGSCDHPGGPLVDLAGVAHDVLDGPPRNGGRSGASRASAGTVGQAFAFEGQDLEVALRFHGHGVCPTATTR